MATTHNRFQVTHRKYGLRSTHTKLMYAMNAAREYVRMLKKYNDPECYAEVSDVMAREGKPQLWLITGTAGTKADYSVTKIRGE